MNFNEAKRLTRGDKILLYSEAELRSMFNSDRLGSFINTPVTTVPGMFPFLGKVQTISTVDVDDNEKTVVVTLEGDDVSYNYDMVTIKERIIPDFPPLQAKPGETVKLYTAEFLKGKFGLDFDGLPKTPVDLTEDMMRFLGKEVTVACVKSYQEYDSEIEKTGYCFEIEEDEFDYWFDMECIEGIVHKKTEKKENKDMFKEFIKNIIEAVKNINEPDDSEKLRTILWMCSSGYIDSTRAAELISNLYKNN